ncbi:4-hydroxyproline 2-epimerase [Haloferula helveola]|uniref:4-hydroxyproline 2-epimerase n=1 Tax=Haloferula helveola TaxID=490095 RepID=A0ABM7RGG4_9BACT|nr:4-hydroxyproline 2-epimerase [Haloferula helveola]
MKVIDSHTGGEPTRIIVEGGPDLGSGPIADRARRFREEHDHIRSAVCNEPRGHDAMVGGMLCEAHEPGCECGIFYFNNVTTLHMCIHGTIGLIATLAHMGRIGPGRHGIDTPVGVVHADLDETGKVTVANVPSYRYRAGVPVEVPGWGEVKGDIAWGGNWFFLIEGFGPDVEVANLHRLTDFSRAVRRALAAGGITGEDGGEIDHVEVFGPPGNPAEADGRNFVLCPGDAYDRSPCGTGTSAKLACLAAANKLAPGEIWRQASILDTVFEGSYEALDGGRILPRVSGRAWVTGQSIYHFQPDDPFQYGIPTIQAS